MSKPSPAPDAQSKPFWDACNSGRLVVQNCKACQRMQHPPAAVCSQCNSAANLEWRQVSGQGVIKGYAVMHDCRVVSLQEDQPFNIAIIGLYEDPAVQMFSHLPGTPADEVPVGATVQVEFEATPATGQKVPEWRVVEIPEWRAVRPAQRPARRR